MWEHARVVWWPVCGRDGDAASERGRGAPESFGSSWRFGVPGHQDAWRNGLWFADDAQALWGATAEEVRMEELVPRVWIEAEADSDGYADAVTTLVLGRVQGAVGAVHEGLEALLAPRYGDANREGD